MSTCKFYGRTSNSKTKRTNLLMMGSWPVNSAYHSGKLNGSDCKDHPSGEKHQTH